MGPRVQVQSGLGTERFPADIAIKYRQIGMDQLVLLQGGLPIEALATGRAHEGLFLLMHQGMRSEQGGTGEGLVAGTARERSDSGVHPFVSSQSCCPRDFCSADGTLTDRVLVLPLLVGNQPSLIEESLVAYRTLERSVLVFRQG